MMDITSKTIRDRILELRRVAARELMPNPKNWRRHPARQAAALRGLLEEIGYAYALLARELPDGRLMLIDGHLRAETTPDQLVPCWCSTSTKTNLTSCWRRSIRWQRWPRPTSSRLRTCGLRHDRQRRVARVARRNGRHREGDSTERDSRASVNTCRAFGPDLATRQAQAAVRRFYRSQDVSRLMGEERAVLFQTDSGAESVRNFLR